MSHTPVPWMIGNGAVVTLIPDPQVEITGEHAANTIQYYGGHVICETVTDENARFIVEACNNYEGLKEKVARLECELLHRKPLDW